MPSRCFLYALLIFLSSLFWLSLEWPLTPSFMSHCVRERNFLFIKLNGFYLLGQNQFEQTCEYNQYFRTFLHFLQYFPFCSMGSSGLSFSLQADWCHLGQQYNVHTISTDLAWRKTERIALPSSHYRQKKRKYIRENEFS